jgi:hypothetical protein
MLHDMYKETSVLRRRNMRKTQTFLACRLGSPGALRASPIDPFEKIAHLSRAQRNHAVVGLGPDDTTVLEALGVARTAQTVVPDRFDQRPVASAKNEDVDGERMTLETLLNDHA